MRILIVILLVLNALAFAAVQGWLGDIGNAHQRGEGERAANALNPGLIQLDRESENRP